MNGKMRIAIGQNPKNDSAAHPLLPAGTMADLLMAMGTAMGDPGAAALVPVLMRRVRAGESLVHEGTPAEALYFVGAGTFKVFRTDLDGYEQVLAIAYRGEVMGYDALCMASHPTAIMALEDSTVYVVLRTELLELSQTLPAFSEALQRAGSQTLIHSREVADMMAAVSSEVRLARYLILMSQRMMAAGQSPRRFRLRMGRRDIASLLGVAHETVSRSFSALSLARLLHVSDREIEILDMEALRDFSRNTRRKTDDLYVSAERAKLGRRRGSPRRATASLGSMAA